MEFHVIAQQQLYLLGTIFLTIFTVFLSVFFGSIYVSGKKQPAFATQVTTVVSLLVCILAFGYALLLSNYEPQDPLFTMAIFNAVKLYSYVVLAAIALLAASIVAVHVQSGRKKRQ